MKQIKEAIRQMIQISESELEAFLSQVISRTFRRMEVLSYEGGVPDEVFFISRGLIRVLVTDADGEEHTVHFALENQFIADYSAFLQKKASLYKLQALEETEVVVLPRSAIEWGYEHLDEGQKLGRLIAEYYFIFQDERIRNTYIRTPIERYDNISRVFPDIHNRVPQHMIASYLGITPIHLSRIKKSALSK